MRELRETNGMSMTELERLTEIPHTTLTRLFSAGDDSSPSFENVLKVVIALEGSIDEIVGLKAPGASETPLTRAYNRIVEEKDTRINKLELAHSLQRREKYAVAAVLFLVIAVIAVLLIVDFANGGMGYVRY